MVKIPVPHVTLAKKTRHSSYASLHYLVTTGVSKCGRTGRHPRPRPIKSSDWLWL